MSHSNPSMQPSEAEIGAIDAEAEAAVVSSVDQLLEGTSINWFFGQLASQMRRPMQDGGLHRPGGL